MTYRMIAADLDGTLHVEQQPFTQRVREAVSKAQERGVRVVMATGRVSRTALPFARDLGLTSPLICNHGASIHAEASGALLLQRSVPLALARQVIAWTPENVTALVCADEEFYVVRASEDALDYGGLSHDHFHIVPDLAQSLSVEPQKIVFVNDEEVSTRILGELRQQFGEQLHIVQSFSRYIEVTHHDVSKATAVAWLAKRWGIPREEVIAIGDQGNDISMIEWAGLGVAMGNGIEGVKAIADYVAPSAAEDGVAHVIEKFVLNV